MSDLVVEAGRLLTHPGRAPMLRDMRVRCHNGHIAAVEPAPAAPAHLLTMPAFFNAHDHGRGLRHIAYGADDGPLEGWLPRLYKPPFTDPFASAAVNFCRLARGGVAGLVSCHSIQRFDHLAAELEASAKAAEAVGIRLALVVPMRDRNAWVYGDQAKFLDTVAAEHREAVKREWTLPAVPPAEMVAFVEAMGQKLDSALVQVQFGPTSAQWCSEGLVSAVADASARTGRRVHMHVLETGYQREWLDAAYPEGGPIAWLDRCGLLSNRLTIAHGVWLTEPEIALLAERDVTVSLNTCSNLRLRSGLAPARGFVAAGLNMGLGIDGATIDDDDDALREFRLVRWLHDGPGFAAGLELGTLFHAAQGAGARAVTGRSDHGAVESGRVADLVTLDFNALAPDHIEGLTNDLEVLVARMSGRHVRQLVVAGREVVRDGQVLGVDETALTAELLAGARADAPRIAALAPAAAGYREAIERWYRGGMHRLCC